MLDHIGISVADLGRSKGFYESALAPLGYVVKSAPAGALRQVCGFGASGHPDFWISGEGRMAPACYIGWQQSLELLAMLVEPDIREQAS